MIETLYTMYNSDFKMPVIIHESKADANPTHTFDRLLKTIYKSIQ